MTRAYLYSQFCIPVWRGAYVLPGHPPTPKWECRQWSDHARGDSCLSGQVERHACTSHDAPSPAPLANSPGFRLVGIAAHLWRSAAWLRRRRGFIRQAADERGHSGGDLHCDGHGNLRIDKSCGDLFVDGNLTGRIIPLRPRPRAHIVYSFPHGCDDDIGAVNVFLFTGSAN
jgi:hypothetical protein